MKAEDIKNTNDVYNYLNDLFQEPLKKLEKIQADLKKARITLDYRLIENIKFDDIDMSDWPDMCDTFICSATYAGREMTEDELNILNEDRDFVYDKLMDYLY